LDNGVADEPVNPADPVENADPDVSADVAVPAEQEAPLDVNCADVLEETANHLQAVATADVGRLQA
jgi:hypothetical protein